MEPGQGELLRSDHREWIDTDPLVTGDWSSAAPRRHRIFDGRESVDCTLVRRASLRPGQGLEGPRIIDDVTSTIFVPAGWRSEVDDHENLIMRRS